MENEIWKDIVGFEGSYQCSNLGRVRSLEREKLKTYNGKPYKITLQERILKPGNDKDGYLMLILYINGGKKPCKIHRLIAQTFIPNPNNRPQVNHKNAIKHDNRVENLEWATPKEDALHRTVMGLIGKGSTHYKAIPISQFTKDGKWVRDWGAAVEVERQTGFYRGTISRCVQGKVKYASGFIWRKKYEKTAN